MSRPAARVIAALTVAAMFALEGCAALLPATPGSPGATGAAAGGAAAGAASAPRAAVDSLPSADAQRVLDSIAEPIPAAERVPPPAAAAAAGAAAATARDSARADSAASDTSRSSVPVPEPTAPLGEKPGSAELAAAAGGVAVAADTARAGGATSGGASAGSPSGAAAGPASGSAAGAGAAAGSSTPCYRLQIAAPKQKQEAEKMKSAAESQLEVPFAITHSGSMYKVRTRDCMSLDAVQHLRERARASGFGGAFSVAPGAP